MRSFLRRRPLRVKISLLMVVLLSAGLLVSSFIATTALSGYLMDRVDEALSAGSRPLMSMAVPLVRVPPTDGQLRPPSRFSVAVVFADGSPTSFVSAADDNAADGPALPTVTDLAASAALGPLTVGPAAGSGDWRILATYVPEVEGWVSNAYIAPVGNTRDAAVARFTVAGPASTDPTFAPTRLNGRGGKGKPAKKGRRAKKREARAGDV